MKNFNLDSAGKVLIIDDDMNNIDVLSFWLEEKGFIVEQLESGENVISFVKKTLPDLILLDIMMPEIDGYDVCRQLKTDVATCNIPVIFMSALNDSSYIVKAFSTGGVDYITKPFQNSEVLARVQTHIALRKTQQALEAKNEELQQEMTERKKIEAELRKSELRYRQIFEQNKAIKLIIDPVESSIVNANQAACQFYGYSLKTITSMKITDINMLSMEEIRMVMKDIKQGNQNVFQFKHRLASGEIRDVEVYSCEIQIDDKKMFYSIVNDISKCKTAEAKLQKVQQEQSIILENVPLGIVFIKNKKFMWMNKKFVELFGFTLDELIGFSIDKCFPSKNDYSESISRSYPMLSSGQTYKDECQLKRKDGTLFWAVVHGKAFNTDKVEEASIWIVNDITIRKNEEKQLMESKKNFEDIFNTSTDMLIIADLQGNIVNANPKAVESYGYSKDEFLKLTIPDLIHPDYKDGFKTFVNDIQTKGFSSLESRDIRKDRSSFVNEVNGNFVEYNGKLHFLGISRDITQRKQAEKELIDAKKASDEANKAKSNFLAVMSHEIRTPMNAIIGMAELTLQTKLNSEQINNIKVIKDSSYHLLNVINEILDFSKIEADKLTLADIDFDLYNLLDSVIFIFTNQAKEKDIFLNLEKSKYLPQYIKGDPIRLRQILVNLINNAVKFTKTGGITIEAAKEDDYILYFSVTDTGIGIPEKKHQLIFESFNQADYSITRNHGGTGLGLTICKKLIGMMGGNISVTSKTGFGSKFSFKIPLRKGNKDNVSLENHLDNWEKLKNDSKPLKILLVEDNSVNAEIAARFLKKLGHNSITASNGKEALTFLTKKKYDLVLMDVEMPVMNGIEATKRIRNKEVGIENSEIPVIAMTAHALNDFREECIKSGMNDFISKPVNFYEMGIVLKNYCSSKPYKPYDSNLFLNNQDESNNQILDKEEALLRYGDCEEMYDKICKSFVNDIENVIENINNAITNKDYNTVRFNAHTLKGLCGNISANTSEALSQQLESMAKEGNINSEKLRPLFEKLLSELEKVKKILR